MIITKTTYPSLLGAGLVCLDIIKTDQKIKYLNGGSCGNVVSALSFLGWKTSVLIGQYRDQASIILNHNLEKLGVQRIEVNSGSSMTPRIVEEVFNNLERDHKFFLTCPKCNRKLPSIKLLYDKYISFDLNNYNVFYSDRTSKGITLLREMFRNKGSWTIYEPNSARNINSLIINSIESHIVKFSSDKISQKIADKIRSEATNGYTLLIIRTMGKEGLVFTYRKRDNRMSNWIHLDAQPVPKFIDSAGAGDWCTTGILFSLVNKHRCTTTYLSKQEVIASLQYGQALSAISCCFLGAQGLIYADINEEIERTSLGQLRKLFDSNLTPSEPVKTLDGKYCDMCLLEN